MNPLSAVRSFLRADVDRELSTKILSTVCDGPEGPGVLRTALAGLGEDYQTYGDGPMPSSGSV